VVKKTAASEANGLGSTPRRAVAIFIMECDVMALVISPPDTSETTIGWPVLSIKYSTGNAPQQSFPAGTQIIFAMDLSWNITAGNA